MNKRIRKKTSKRKNMSRQKVILTDIAKEFKITDKMFGDGYFVFTMGPNAVCHFSLKETPGWRYGIWLDRGTGFQIFGEHEDLIDKFKPSRTYVSHSNDLRGFIQEVKNISKNLKLYFVDSWTDGEALEAVKSHIDSEDDEVWYSGYQVSREYNPETECYDKFIFDDTITQQAYVDKEYKEFYDGKAKRQEDIEFDRVYAFNFFKELPNIYEEIEAIGIKDSDKSGWRTDPRYEILVVMKKGVVQEHFEDFADKLEDFIRDKNYSDDRKTYEHRFDLNSFYTKLKDIKDCDYKYYKSEGVM